MAVGEAAAARHGRLAGRSPAAPRWKVGIAEHLGWPHGSQADLALAWRRILSSVGSYADLEPELLGRVEELIDFVTAPG